MTTTETEEWPDGPLTPTMGGSCVLVKEGPDTDGETMFYRCTVHDNIVIGYDTYCEDA